jgi:uncharacterized membrane protein (UPF0127 family)
MSKLKTQSLRKQPKKNRWMQITIVVVLIAFVAYLILSNVLVKEKPVNKELEETVKNQTVFTFTKEGELTFSDAGGKFITRIDLEIADDNHQREQGLMFRENMDEDQGMLFIFDNEVIQSFWMRNTVLPLDIIYVNFKMEIVHIAKNAKPFDETSIPSIKPAKYVVEVVAGYCDKLGIKEGDKIVWRRE